MIFLFIALLLHLQSRNQLQKQRDAAVLQAHEQAFSFGLMLKTATQPTKRTAQLATLLPDWPNKEYWRWFRGLLLDSPAIYGTGVTFWPPNRGGQRKDLYALRGKDGNFRDELYSYQDETFTYDGADGTHEWFNAPQKKGVPTWSAPYFDDGSGNVWMVTFSVPFYRKAGGTFDGVAFSDIRIDTLREQMNELRNFKDGDFIILSSDNTYVYHPETKLIGQPASAWTALGELSDWVSSDVLPEGDPPIQTRQWPGHSAVWVARHQIPETGWILISIRRDDSVAFGLYYSDISVSVLLAVLLLGLIWAAISLTSKFTRSISLMTEAAESVARGNWKIQLPEVGKDELGRLARSLNQMGRELALRDEELRQQNRELECFNLDLEERVKKRTEQLAIARAEAESANAAKSRFIANISHELRTPMNAIVGFSRLAPTLPKETYASESLDYFKKISTAARSLSKLLNDLLDFSKIDAGGIRLESVSFVLSDLIDHVCEINSEVAREKGIELKWMVDRGVPKSVIGDPLRLGQVLTNLVNNAVKFSSSGQVLLSVDCKTELAEVPLEASIFVRFSVRDEGIGIAPEVLPNLFRPFTQADVSTTRLYGGTGLGLAICSELVKVMGGEISVESEPEKGSTFSFAIKLTPDTSTVNHELVR